MTDTSTDPYAITVDPDGIGFRWYCNTCPAQAYGNDEGAVRENADGHQEEAHSGRTNSSTSKALAVAVGEVRRLQAENTGLMSQLRTALAMPEMRALIEPAVSEGLRSKLNLAVADLERLHADATRALGVLGLLITEVPDPGAEALAAQACLTQTLVNTRRSAP